MNAASDANASLRSRNSSQSPYGMGVWDRTSSLGPRTAGRSRNTMDSQFAVNRRGDADADGQTGHRRRRESRRARQQAGPEPEILPQRRRPANRVHTASLK